MNPLSDTFISFITVILLTIGNFLYPSIFSEREVKDYVEKITFSPSPTSTPQPPDGQVLSSTEYDVIRVVDGDTIVIKKDGKNQTVRLIGINTPESVDPRRPVECFAVEASNYAKQLLTGKKVTLETDPTQDTYDRYQRLLAYVYLESGEHINLTMIQKGYAYEYTYNEPYIYQSAFKEAQQQAQHEQRGLWNPNACNGNEG